MYDRLYSNAIRSEKLRKEVLSRIKVQEELQGCTFAPQVGWRRSWCFYIRALATLLSAAVPCCANIPSCCVGHRVRAVLVLPPGESFFQRRVWGRVCVPASVQARPALGTHRAGGTLSPPFPLGVLMSSSSRHKLFTCLPAPGSGLLT